MKPTTPPHRDRQQDLFRLELVQIINPRHPLLRLSHTVDWDRLDELFGATFCPDQGRPCDQYPYDGISLLPEVDPQSQR